MGKCDENNRIYKIGFITIAVFCFFLSIAIGIMAAYITSKPKTEEINSSIPDTANVVESIEESVEDKDKISQDEGIKSLEDIAELKSAVVKIETETTQGSGVLISEEGHILTNWHIIEGSEESIIVYFNGKDHKIHNEHKYAEIIGIDPFIDLALLKIDKTPEWLDTKYIELGDINSIKEGQKIVTIGSPRGLMNTMSDGIISAIRKDADRTYIQITAPLSPGSSGGALINEKGQLIGITTFKVREAENLNFAISLKDIVEFLNLNLVRNFHEYKNLKQVIFESTIRDAYNGADYDFIIFSDNWEKEKDRSFINGSTGKVEEILTGNLKIAYSQGDYYKVRPINFFQMHNSYGLDIPLKFSFIESAKQFFVLNSSDTRYPELLITSSYGWDDIWTFGVISLENEEIVEWLFFEEDGWVNNTTSATYIRRVQPDKVEIIATFDGRSFYYEYYIEPQLNILRGISEGEEIDNINSYINSGGWIKIGYGEV